MDGQKFVYRGGSGEYEEKKSRFIATLEPVHSEEEALELIAGLRKKYWDARHNCYAYIIGDRAQLQRCSDDGEPQGTAGRPMLEVLQGAGVTDVCAVVTRYFGGTLLGTGGLVRAYTKATSAGLEDSVVLERIEGVNLTIRTDYNGIGKIQYLIGQRGLTTTDARYTDIVELDVLIPGDEKEELIKAVTEATAGRAEFPEEVEVRYAINDGEAVML